MAQRDEATSASWLADLGVGGRRVDVDATSLTSFATSLRAELVANFLPYSEHVGQLAGPPRAPSHCPWGAAAADLSATVTGVDAHLDECVRMLNQVLSGGQWLANAAELISDRYQASDLYAQATAAGIAEVLWAPAAETAVLPRERSYE